MIFEMFTPVRSKAQLAGLIGAQSRFRLIERMAHFGFRWVLLVTDEVLFKLGVIDPIVERLNDLGTDTDALAVDRLIN
ncbi:MAG TPA: hypothetical protein VL091_12725 [Marinobacter sp.]|nr:hypothetical protein [Marinobacter sp.]